MQEINYNLEMISEAHREQVKFGCELGEKKKIKLPIRNPTPQLAQILEPKLPR
jgi:hypothetical protein